MDNSLIGLYRDIEEHLMFDGSPSDFLRETENNPLFGKYPFTMLGRLKETGQSPEHHPEGNVWNHTLLVTDEAAKVRHKSKNPLVFMWAALLHDIGKPITTRIRSGRIIAYDHDRAGEKLCAEFLSHFKPDKEFIRQVSGLVRYHMQILFVAKRLPFADIKGMKESTDIAEVALLGLCDRLGRTNSNRGRELENIRLFLHNCGEKQLEHLFTE